MVITKLLEGLGLYSTPSRILKMIRHRGNLSLLSCVVFFAFSAVHAGAPIVRTRNGTLAGLMMQTRQGKDFVGFRGIPYAIPPLGELRFQPPKPAAAWDGVRSAKDDAEICVQRNYLTNQEEVVGVEDCLYLNVYTPKVPSDEEAATFHRFPVMIWFHGGGWFTGAGHSFFYGPKFLLDHDVVLVTGNYRLGSLGFLSTEDMECPGNVGMKDQVQIIRWVHENIVFFGGDPNRVTIFGESAGGASVHYHMISPLSQGLFHRGIAESGTAYCPWAFIRPGLAKKNANIMGEHLNCPTESSKELIACLRTKKATDIIDTDRVFRIFSYDPIVSFAPVIEPNHPGAFLTEDPIISTKHGRIADIPWMLGVTSEEGTLRVPALHNWDNGEQVKKLNKEYKKIMPITLMYENTCPKSIQNDVSSKIREFYFGDRAIDISTTFQTIDMYSDSLFIHPVYKSVRDYLDTQSSPIYFYYFTYKGTSSYSKLFGGSTTDYGVSHADELQYLFPVGEQLFPDVPLSKEDHRIIDVMTSLWFNFANSENPTPKITKTIPAKWNSVKTSNDFKYLYIAKSKFVMKKGFLPERMKFWDSLPVYADPKMKQKVKEEL
ncbi:PREDICTED: venom carboxylesterase-6-like isoform X2 [Dinoponera quadriceps]|uniref:Carboxylic ester hydrolase n=1 Tax=Dinoponera quadriceps TaxID=609295 RepID=A0A6P3Y0N7_DINQU|nr:PREDICTED: venom carboxylesterase-6-like isoform X2 [Dinoponera quadriceps]